MNYFEPIGALLGTFVRTVSCVDLSTFEHFFNHVSPLVRHLFATFSPFSRERERSALTWGRSAAFCTDSGSSCCVLHRFGVVLLCLHRLGAVLLRPASMLRRVAQSL